jgi:hypothetical protein
MRSDGLAKNQARALKQQLSPMLGNLHADLQAVLAAIRYVGAQHYG